MKINEIIILENDAELRQRLEQEFDDEYGDSSGNKLPQFIMLDKASVVALAVGYIKRPKWSPGMALKYAVKQLYPDFKVTYSGMSDDQIDTFKNAKPDAPVEPTVSVQDKIKNDMKRKADQPTGTVGGQIGNKNAYKGGGSFKTSRLNPFAGTDQSSLRKAIGSGLAKARSNFKNSDTFKVKKS